MCVHFEFYDDLYCRSGPRSVLYGMCVYGMIKLKMKARNSEREKERKKEEVERES